MNNKINVGARVDADYPEKEPPFFVNDYEWLLLRDFRPDFKNRNNWVHGMTAQGESTALIIETVIAHEKTAQAVVENDDDYDVVELFGYYCLFTNNRVDRSKLPEGLFCFDIRGTDEDPGELAFLERSVTVNHAGSIIAGNDLLGCLEDLDIRGEIDFTYIEISLSEYYETITMKWRAVQTTYGNETVRLEGDLADSPREALVSAYMKKEG